MLCGEVLFGCLYCDTEKMKIYLFSVLLIGYTYANDDVQYIKSVKGGGGGIRYNPGANLVRYFGNETQFNNSSFGYARPGYNTQQQYDTQQYDTQQYDTQQQTFGDSFNQQHGYNLQNSTHTQQHTYPPSPRPLNINPSGPNQYPTTQPGYSPGNPQYPGYPYSDNRESRRYPSEYPQYPGSSPNSTQPGYHPTSGYPHPDNKQPGQNPGSNPQSNPGFNPYGSRPNYPQRGDTPQYPDSDNLTPGNPNGGRPYNPLEHTIVDYNRPGFNNVHGSNQYGGYNTNYEVGVCYIEVPTASLVRDPKHVPQGNGSRADLSRIRTCCKGYIRNIYNYKICDPVCTKECVNALCSAPETCTCFPDHVKNLAGYCVATCPIGCQNGHCAGGECLCNPGYKLDPDSRYCLPSCKDNCGGFGNCTSPNRCECKAGYKSNSDGTCKLDCGHCDNGDCVSPTECRCHQGFTKDQQGNCKATCTQCVNGDCVGPNQCRCHAGFNKDHTGVCKPHCDNCANGECIGPNECRCEFGYSKDSQGSCKPICENCVNGDCIGPNECKCHSGYTRDQYGKCAVSCPPECGPSGCSSANVCNSPSYGRPHVSTSPPYTPYHSPNQPDNFQYQQTNQGQQCSQPCLNGFCAEDDKCKCIPGYTLDPEDPSGRKCVPHCPGGCPNGVCSSPNFCICNMGYYKDHSVKGRAVCIKRIR